MESAGMHRKTSINPPTHDDFRRECHFMTCLDAVRPFDKPIFLMHRMDKMGKQGLICIQEYQPTINFRHVSIRFATAIILVGASVGASGEESKPEAEKADDVKPVAAATPTDALAETVEKAIQVTSQRRLTAGVHTPWQVVHGILAQRWDLSLLKQDFPGGEMNAIE